MKIEHSNLSMASQSQSMVRYESQERFQSGSRRQPQSLPMSIPGGLPASLQAESAPDGGRLASPASTPVSISARARSALANDLKAATEAMMQQWQTQGVSPSQPAGAIDQAFDAAENDPVVGLLKSMIEMMTGEIVRLFSPQDLALETPSSMPVAASLGQAAHAGSLDLSPVDAGAGMAYDYRSVYEEFEQTSFSASDTIKTADGQEISFQLDLSMVRYYREETSVSVRSGAAQRQDPLVLNFDGNAAQLSNRQFLFDLLGDGSASSLPLLEGNRAYLAFDRNGNGKIDSGLELFGPSTRSGFQELAALDSDGNGWVDEYDAAFKSLSLWTPAARGEGRLQSLSEKQVGAIAVAHAATPFEVRGDGNRDLGAIARTGLFLRDKGQAGTVQEVNLTAA